MPEVDLRAFEDTIVVHFGTEGNQINAYTLATTLINLADAATAANAELNPGYDVEVVVEALRQGSFKATIRAVYRGANNLFSRDNLKAIVIGVIASYVYQHTLAPRDDVHVHINTDEVIVERGDDRVIVPRAIHDATQQIEGNKRFVDSISKAMQSVASDDDVRTIGFAPFPGDEQPVLPIPKERLFPLYIDSVDKPPDVREFDEIADLRIVRAILERSNRRWEFIWNGIRISAPVTDRGFYDAFFDHRITIAPGDLVKVRLKIRQRRNHDLKIYINDSYEVSQVINHVPRDQSGKQIDRHE